MLAIILISYFMILLDNSVVFTGLPSIRADLDLDAPSCRGCRTPTRWCSAGCCCSAPGPATSSAGVGSSSSGSRSSASPPRSSASRPTGWWIIAARALQGIGAAIVAPTSLALITAYFDGETRTRAVAWYAATAGIGASLGLLVGGALTDLVSWRAAFLVNVPIAVAMIVGARAVLVETPRRAGRFDVVRCRSCATLGMGALVFGIIESAETGWASARVVVAARRRRRPAGRARGQRGQGRAADHAAAALRAAASAAVPTPPACSTSAR